MKKYFGPWSVAWTVVSILLTIGSFLGGDLAIVAGWGFLIWTLPFGLIWWFVIYEYIPHSYATPSVQLVGELLCVILAFVFWFVLIPWLRGAANKLNKKA